MFIKKCVLFLLVLFYTSSFCFTADVLVSVAPYISIVKRIGGENISIQLMVPQGADSHNFEPSPKQVAEAAKAKIWFCVGECFEKKIQGAFKNHNSSIIIEDLRQNLPPDSSDPHIWMSPLLMKIQAKTIAEGLKKVLPDRADEIATNLQHLLVDLDTLDQQIRSMLQGKKNRVILTAHPAYGYFCKDYDIQQLSIEQEGHEPTPKEITLLLQQAKELHISKVIIQSPYGHKGATLIADQLQAKLVVVNPYNEDFFAMMLECAREFS